eukprot:665649-Prorocentrum_minimum.AAC.3
MTPSTRFRAPVRATLITEPHRSFTHSTPSDPLRPPPTPSGYPLLPGAIDVRPPLLVHLGHDGGGGCGGGAGFEGTGAADSVPRLRGRQTGRAGGGLQPQQGRHTGNV